MLHQVFNRLESIQNPAKWCKEVSLPLNRDFSYCLSLDSLLLHSISGEKFIATYCSNLNQMLDNSVLWQHSSPLGCSNSWFMEQWQIMVPVVFHKLYLWYAGFSEAGSLLLFQNHYFFKKGNKFKIVSGVCLYKCCKLHMCLYV